jgi:polysaccharide biosynthesis protein PslJ
VVSLLALLLGVGRLIPDQPIIAGLVAVAVLLVGLTLADPTIIPLLSIPVLLVVVRVGAGGVDLSLSDVVLFGAFWPALVLGPRPFSPPLRALLWLVALYEAATLFTVIANPFTANAVEWVHAGFLTGGALIVGWALGRSGRGSVTLTLLLLAATVIAVSTIVQGVRGLPQGFTPVFPRFPFAMHKNYAGTILGIAAVVAYVHPPWMRWPRLIALIVFGLCVAGMIFTQSRQAVIGLAVALAVVVLRSDDTRKRSKVIVFAGIAGLALVAGMVRDQIDSGNQFNSLFQRINWYQDSLDVWSTDPIFGAGLRWWYTDRFASRFQPPNAEMEVLTTAGLVGIAAFLVFMVGSLVILWRLPVAYGTLAFCVVLSRFVQAQFDLFWVAAQVSVPFVVAGVCLGQGALAASAAATAAEREHAGLDAPVTATPIAVS